MAAKKNKAKKPSKKKPYYGRRCVNWLQLPKEIVQLIPRNRKTNLLHCVRYATGVTKAWVPTISRCGCEQPPPPRLRRIDASAYLKYLPGDCPFTAERAARIDDIKTYNYKYNDVWAQYEVSLADPFKTRRNPLFQKVEGSHVDFTSKIYFEGKNYAMSLQGTLLIVETIDSRPTITGVASNRAVPSRSGRFFKEYLIEFDGEIFIIFYIHQESLGIVDGVEVFRLCLSELKWIKAERIGGKVLFLEPQFLWGNSAYIGCKGDCIYFTQASSSGWLVYDMENSSISDV